MTSDTIIFEKNALDALTSVVGKFAPPLSRITLVCDDETLSAIIRQRLKEYRISDGIKEDTALVIGAGSENSVYKAKKTAISNALKIIVVSPPWCDALLNADAYVFDPQYILKSDVPSLFGAVVSRANSASDAAVDNIFYGERRLTYAKKATSLASSLACRDATEGEIADAAFKSAVLSRFLPSYGEAAVSYLFKASQKTELSMGELRMLFAPALNALYLYHLKNRRYMTLPPDNEYRKIRLAELGVKCKPRRLLMGRECLETEYKLNFCSCETISTLTEANNILRKGFVKYKALYSDLGFSLNSVSGDFSAAIALAPDACRTQGILGVLKDLGELDCYID